MFNMRRVCLIAPVWVVVGVSKQAAVVIHWLVRQNYLLSILSLGDWEANTGKEKYELQRTNAYRVSNGNLKQNLLLLA